MNRSDFQTLACIARLTREFDFPPDPRTLENVYTHNLEALVRGAGLEEQLSEDLSADSTLRLYWRTVRRWSEESRYKRVSQLDAQELYTAVSDNTHGVFRWLQQHW